MFKRKIALKKARKLAGGIPSEIRQEIKFLTGDFYPIAISATTTMLKLNSLTKNLRNYGNIEDMVHTYNK